MELRLALLSCFLYITPTLTVFHKETLVVADQSHAPIEQLAITDVVLSLSQDTYSYKSVSHTHNQHIYRCIGLTLDADTIITSADQQFYCVETASFERADGLVVGQHLLNAQGKTCEIRAVDVLDCDEIFYGITVADNHTYFVSRAEVLVHNVAPVVVGLGWAFGGGAIEFVGTSIGTVLCGIAVGLKAQKDDEKYPQYNLYTDCFEDNEGSIYYNDAQAPGKPTEKDGFIPPKKWDGKKVRHPKTGQVGYPDRNGDVWVPTGPGPLAHRGPHWDVINRKGKHKNVLPGGRIC